MAEKLTRSYSYDENTLYTKAKSELERQMEQKLSSLNPSFSWNDGKKNGTFNIKGVKGSIKVSGSTLSIELTIPFLLKAFKGKILDNLNKSLDNI